MLRRGGEVALAVHRNEGEPGVRGGILRIDLECPRVCLAGAGKPLRGGHQAGNRLVAEVGGESAPRRGVGGVDLQRPVQQRVGLLEPILGVLARKLNALEVERVGLGGRLARRGRLAKQGDLELLHDVGGDLVLDGEDVVELPVIRHRRDVEAVGPLDELSGDAHLVADLAHGALQHVGHIQPLRNLRDPDVLSLE